jgi:hypothetical protein
LRVDASTHRTNPESPLFSHPKIGKLSTSLPITPRAALGTKRTISKHRNSSGLIDPEPVFQDLHPLALALAEGSLINMFVLVWVHALRWMA